MYDEVEIFYMYVANCMVPRVHVRIMFSYPRVGLKG